MTARASSSWDLTPGRFLIALWGVAGVLALLGQAVSRLAPRALEPIENGDLTLYQGAIYAAWAVFSAYTEGYRAFQLRFSPRVVARALYLAKNPQPLHVLLAPAYCMCFFHANRRNRIIAWATVAMVTFFIISLRYAPYPWRGIGDGGVVLALIWGAIAIVYYFVRGLSGHAVPSAVELPEDNVNRASHSMGSTVDSSPVERANDDLPTEAEASA